MVFSKEQLDKLYDAEIHFKTATTQGYLKNCPRWLVDKVADVYEEATGSKVNRNWGCSVCVLNFMILVGKMYFKDKKELENSIVADESEPTPREATEKPKNGKKNKSSHK